MVEIIAIVNRARTQATKEELGRIGCAGYTRFTVLGRGKQRGLRDQNGKASLSFLPKVLFRIIVEDADEAETVEAIIRANQTGQYGDGRVFVMPIECALRVSEPCTEAMLQECAQS